MDRVLFFHLLDHQLDGGLINKLSESDVNSQYADADADKDIDSGENDAIGMQPYDEVFGYLEELQNDFRTKIMVFYQPKEQFSADGIISFPHEDTYDAFVESANNHHISFVDITSEFERMYDNDYSVPHGFITGKIGVGHLNSNGHYAVAKSLYQAIQELEEANDADH